MKLENAVSLPIQFHLNSIVLPVSVDVYLTLKGPGGLNMPPLPLPPTLFCPLLNETPTQIP